MTRQPQRFSAQTTAAGNSCDIRYYVGAGLSEGSDDMPEDEIEALTIAMHETLQSISFWNKEK